LPDMSYSQPENKRIIEKKNEKLYKLKVRTIVLVHEKNDI